MRKRLFVLLLFSLIIVPMHSIDIIKYPYNPSHGKSQQYLIEILTASLEKTISEYGEYKLVAYDEVLTINRAFAQVYNNQQINIAWGSPFQQNIKLVPIHIPVMKGLFGYHLFIINGEYQEEYEKIHTLDQLKKFSIGQVRGWGDSRILKYNGFHVIEATQYNNLFRMLSSGRFDLLPLGIIEATHIIEEQQDEYPLLHIEETLLLYYPSPFFFYFSPDNPRLKERIEEGLRIMIADGTFNVIFMTYFGDSLENIDISGRRVFRLDSPDTDDGIPYGDEKIWLDPFM